MTKKIENLRAEPGLSEALVKRIRDLVRKWYGAISVNELAKNSDLIAEIASFESWMGKMVAP